MTGFQYDTLRRVTETDFPSGLHESYAYDASGNLLSKTDRDGHTITYAYDGLNRLLTKSYPDSTAVNYSYDAGSRLTQVADASGTYGFTYDNLGRTVGTATAYSFLVADSGSEKEAGAVMLPPGLKPFGMSMDASLFRLPSSRGGLRGHPRVGSSRRSLVGGWSAAEAKFGTRNCA